MVLREQAIVDLPCDIVESRFQIEVFDSRFVFALARVGLEFGISVANLLRAHGGCLGVERMKGVEVCEMPGGVDTQAVIPGFPTATC